LFDKLIYFKLIIKNIKLLKFLKFEIFKFIKFKIFAFCKFNENFTFYLNFGKLRE